MSLTGEQIKNFQKILKEEHGKELSHKEAYEAAENLVGFFKLLWEIDSRNSQKEKESK
jgi:hypothetical protein